MEFFSLLYPLEILILQTRSANTRNAQNTSLKNVSWEQKKINKKKRILTHSNSQLTYLFCILKTFRIHCEREAFLIVLPFLWMRFIKSSVPIHCWGFSSFCFTTKPTRYQNHWRCFFIYFRMFHILFSQILLTKMCPRLGKRNLNGNFYR